MKASIGCAMWYLVAAESKQLSYHFLFDASLFLENIAAYDKTVSFCIFLNRGVSVFIVLLLLYVFLLLTQFHFEFQRR